MRNLLFVLVFISMTVLGCEGNKSPLENCADKPFVKYIGPNHAIHKMSYKEKMQDPYYVNEHRECEKERMVAPKTFDVKYQ